MHAYVTLGWPPGRTSLPNLVVGDHVRQIGNGKLGTVISVEPLLCTALVRWYDGSASQALTSTLVLQSHCSARSR